MAEATTSNAAESERARRRSRSPEPQPAPATKRLALDRPFARGEELLGVFGDDPVSRSLAEFLGVYSAPVNSAADVPGAPDNLKRVLVIVPEAVPGTDLAEIFAPAGAVLQLTGTSDDNDASQVLDQPPLCTIWGEKDNYFGAMCKLITTLFDLAECDKADTKCAKNLLESVDCALEELSAAKIRVRSFALCEQLLDHRKEFLEKSRKHFYAEPSKLDPAFVPPATDFPYVAHLNCVNLA